MTSNEWEKAKNARDLWLERMIIIGIIGLITIVANMSSPESLMTHFGIQIALISYAVFIVICLVKVIIYQRKMRRILKALSELKF